MRTALSRMVAAGELSPDGGEYRLVGRLLERKAAQDIGRRPAPTGGTARGGSPSSPPPDATSPSGGTSASHMANLRMGELRPDTWLRPANLAGPAGAAGLVVVRGPLHGDDRPRWRRGCGRCPARRPRPAAARPRRARPSPPSMPSSRRRWPCTIGPSAAVVRFLRAEPLLPPPLTPHPWPPDELRSATATSTPPSAASFGRPWTPPPDHIRVPGARVRPESVHSGCVQYSDQATVRRVRCRGRTARGSGGSTRRRRRWRRGRPSRGRPSSPDAPPARARPN